MVHPLQPLTKLESQSIPMVLAAFRPLVTAGAPRAAWPAKGCICAFHAVIASAGLMLACSVWSGSLKPSKCLDPAAIAFLASAAQLAKLFCPQQRGTNSTPDGRDPPDPEAQLYAHEICPPDTKD